MIDMTKVQSFSDEDLLALWRSALAALSLNQSYTLPGGRVLARADLPEARDMIDWLESRIQAARYSGGMNAAVEIR